jgi:hypothetical protein
MYYYVIFAQTAQTKTQWGGRIFLSGCFSETVRHNTMEFVNVNSSYETESL